jgi:hypothetical protein
MHNSEATDASYTVPKLSGFLVNSSIDASEKDFNQSLCGDGIQFRIRCRVDDILEHYLRPQGALCRINCTRMSPVLWRSSSSSLRALVAVESFPIWTNWIPSCERPLSQSA